MVLELLLLKYVCKQCGNAFERRDRFKAKYCGDKCSRASRSGKYEKNHKKAAVEYKGGKCKACGYSKSLSALSFHHVDASKKGYSIGKLLRFGTWGLVKSEIDKCILLCANCHMELHELERNK